MSKALFLAVGLTLLMIPSAAFSGGDDPILEFDTMAGVIGPFVGAANVRAGVPGAGLPWQIEEAEGDLRTDGSLRVEVEGLVLLNAAPVPPNLRGINPQPAFRAVVSCLTIVGGQMEEVNRVTGPFPATPEGDATIEANVNLPSPCFAPIVFVTTGAGDPPRWFSVTGH